MIFLSITILNAGALSQRKCLISTPAFPLFLLLSPSSLLSFLSPSSSTSLPLFLSLSHFFLFCFFLICFYITGILWYKQSNGQSEQRNKIKFRNRTKCKRELRIINVGILNLCGKHRLFNKMALGQMVTHEWNQVGLPHDFLHQNTFQKDQRSVLHRMKPLK